MTKFLVIPSGGKLVGKELLENIKLQGLHGVKIDVQLADDIQSRACVDEVLEVGLQPFVIIRRPEQLLVMPDEGPIYHLGNEPDMEHEGWNSWTYASFVDQCQDIAMERKLEGRPMRLVAGEISNLSLHGCMFLHTLPWSTWDPAVVAAGFHRYPEGGCEGGCHPSIPHKGFGSCDDELAQFRWTVGPRDIYHSEAGFNGRDYTEAQVAEYTDWSVKFYRSRNVSTYGAYQINDGPPDDEDIEAHYGYRRYGENPFDWKPVMAAFAAA